MRQSEGVQDEANVRSGTPRALLAPTPSGGEEVPQERPQLLRVQCPPLGGCGENFLNLGLI